MRTKAFHAFEQKLSYFDDDIELIDVLRLNVTSGDLSETHSPNVLKKVNPGKHKHLSRRQNSDGSRKLIINHLRATLYSSYVKDIYEEVTHYLRTILEKSAANGFDSGRIIGEHSFKINAKEILQSGNWEIIVRLITNSVFQALESEKSTLSLLDKIAKKLNLNIDDNLIKAALPYLEIRHFLVHADGKVSSDFKEKYPKIKITRDGYVIMNSTFISQMRDAIKKLIAAYDQQIISHNLLKTTDLQP